MPLSLNCPTCGAPLQGPRGAGEIWMRSNTLNDNRFFGLVEGTGILDAVLTTPDEAVCRKLCNSACRRGSESRAYEITHKSANRPR